MKKFKEFFNWNIGFSLRIKFIVSVLFSLLIGPIIAKEINGLINSYISYEQLPILSTIINAVVVTAVILFLTNRLIISPIREMIQVTRQLAEGDLDTETIEVNRNDEVGELQQEINLMMTNMNDMLKDIDQTTQQVDKISSDLSMASEETGEMATQAASAIQQVASSSERHVSLIQDLKTDIQKVNGDVDGTSQISIKDISQTAGEGTELVDEAVDTMKEVNQRINQSADTVERLNDFTNEISQFVEVITNIAEQTNLLALNASIEAARAGEHGQGFAVVAEEIRQLAVESNEAAEDIVDLISRMKEQSKNTVTEMRQGRKQANTGLEIINSADELFMDIKERVNKLAQTLDNVTEATEEMTVFTEEVSASAQEVTGISEEQSAEAQQTAAIADRLDSVVDDLHELVVKDIDLYKS
ncbi:hypothetical protein JCM16358_16120 [Halanaerocella petrolearia]